MATMLFQGHGSYRLTLDDDTVIYVDPYFGKEYELEADLILVTHDHFDHDAVDKMPMRLAARSSREGRASHERRVSLHGISRREDPGSAGL